MASATYNNQGVSARVLVQGLNSHEGNINVSVHEDSGKRLDLLNWLSLVSIEKHHEDLKSDLIIAKDSGRWFMDSDKYLDWEDSTNSNRVLWCPGHPGAGKTVMVSLVIDRLTANAASFRHSHKNSVCWLYLGHTDAKGRPGALLGALLRHLVCKSENIPHCVQDLHRKHAEVNTSPTDGSIMNCMIEVCQGHENIFLVVDAMDEYYEAERSLLLRYLHEMLQKLPALRILITSRRIQAIADELGSPNRHDIEAHDDDLDAFIRAQLDLDKNKHLKRFATAKHGTDVPLVDKIVKNVIHRSDRIFLLAKLQLDHVASKRTEADCLAALNEPPMDRNALYAKTMDRIMAQPEEDRDWAVRILTWVFRAVRTLSIEELQIAIQREPFSGSILNDSSKLSDEDIMQFCGGLVSINKHTNSVVLFHYTVREYFSQNPGRYFHRAHDRMTVVCVSRLTTICWNALWENNQSFEVRQGCEITSAKEDQELETVPRFYRLSRALHDYELGRYSIEWFHHHARRTEEPSHTDSTLSLKIYRQLLDLVSDPRTRELLVRLLMHHGQYGVSSPRYEKFAKPTAIHVAASLGLYGLTVALLGANASRAINDKDFNDETAVMIAMRREYSHLVTLFVQRGADVDLRTSTGRKVLLYAAGKGLPSVADKIITQAQKPTSGRKLRRRLGLNNLSGDEGVSLLCAAYHGDRTTVTRLLKDSTFIKVAKRDGVLGVCLLLAAQKRKYEVVRTLLAEGVDINSRDASGRTALHHAADWNDKDLVEMLLEHNADVDIKDHRHMTAWSSICGSDDHAEVDAILVKAKTDVNTKGEDGVTTLYVAAAGGVTQIVRRLLNSGTDPNIATRYGWCPLHWAANNGHYDCTKLLLDFGADPNPLSDTRETPLDKAVICERDTIISLLLEHGAKHARELVGPDRPIIDSPYPHSANSKDLTQGTEGYEDREPDKMTSASFYEDLKLPAATSVGMDDTSNLDLSIPEREGRWKRMSWFIDRGRKAGDLNNTSKLLISWPKRKRY